MPKKAAISTADVATTVKTDTFTVSELATGLRRSVSTATKALEKAIEDGAVKLTSEVRKTGTRGRPSKLFTLTAKGKKLAA